MHTRRVYLRFDLNQTILQFTQARTHRRELRADVRATPLGGAQAPRNLLSHHSCLIIHNQNRSYWSCRTYNKSIRSTTPTIAESIAAPACPVAAVDALQPSCTISTVSPTPASTESSANTE